MRFFLSVMVAFLLAVSFVEAKDDLPGRVEGTYKSVRVKDKNKCSALCKDEGLKCRGVMVYQPDASKAEAICHFNDGLQSGSLFEIKPPTPLDIDIALADLNAYREAHDLPPVNLSAGLIEASEQHAKDIGENGLSGHTGSDGSTAGDRALRSGYKFSLLGENVAAGQKDWDEVFKAWQESPGHNENLLLPGATEFGIALVYEPSTAYGIYWSMLMGAPLG